MEQTNVYVLGSMLDLSQMSLLFYTGISVVLFLHGEGARKMKCWQKKPNVFITQLHHSQIMKHPMPVLYEWFIYWWSASQSDCGYERRLKVGLQILLPA